MRTEVLESLIGELKAVQADFFSYFGVTDIITNSKIFEILIADSLNHTLIPGHSGSRDAKDDLGNEYEYKHYKESSSNHSWTFNDFSDTTIAKLANTKSVIFAHIQDKNIPFPKFDWYYEVPGQVISLYLAKATKNIRNHRKMINVSSKQIENNLLLTKQFSKDNYIGRYYSWIEKIIQIMVKIERIVETNNVLTSNKFWEILVSLKLNHKVLSEQSKHDAEDIEGNKYEYKVSKSSTWSFQDISKEVLSKYLSNKSMVLAIVDKNEISVKKIYEADAKKVVILLKAKLRIKAKRYKEAGKEIRRLQISLNNKDLKRLKAKLLST